ncbi:MAG: MBL fold metallo-hydrolase [Algisphaera sp.]
MDLFAGCPMREATQQNAFKERGTGVSQERSGKEPTLGLCVLGSGSGGNASVLTCTPGKHARPSAVLIDAGLGPRTTTLRLHQVGMTLSDLSGVCVTHFDTDHFCRTWIKTLVDLEIPLYCHRRHGDALRKVRDNQKLESAGLVRLFDEDERFDVAPFISARAMLLQHDRQGTSGFRFMLACGNSVGYVTDLGHAPESLCQHFAGVDVLCIESNYDEQMAQASSRPSFVNRRNLSDAGHLSNDQALAAVQRIVELSPRGNPRKVVLLHRSEECNHPVKVRQCFGRDRSIAKRLLLSEQLKPTGWVRMQALPAVQRGQGVLGGSGF